MRHTFQCPRLNLPLMAVTHKASRHLMTLSPPLTDDSPVLFRKQVPALINSFSFKVTLRCAGALVLWFKELHNLFCSSSPITQKEALFDLKAAAAGDLWLMMSNRLRWSPVTDGMRWAQADL